MIFNMTETNSGSSIITDLVGTTWELTLSGSDSINVAGSATLAWYINFESNNTQFTYIELGYSRSSFADIHYNNTQVWYSGSQINPSYKTITITGGSDATNSIFIAWLQSQATQIS